MPGLLSLPLLVLALAPSAPPNVVFVLVDDLGYADLGCYGGEAFETPRIDRLAAEGVRFTDFYAACPVCSPTRASIQSGQYQTRLRITDFIPGHWRPFERLNVPYVADHLPLAIETPAELLAAADYRSGYFGKWHLGHARGPDRQGYDVASVVNGHWLMENPKQPGQMRRAGPAAAGATYGTDWMAAEATGFLDDHLAEHAEQPFFLFLSPFAVHIPLAAKADTVAKYEQKLGGASGPDGPLPSPVYAAMVEHVDAMVGQVLDKLDEAGVADETMVIVTSDNGGLYKMYTGQGHRVTDNGPLRGEKGTVYEGGIRVPCIVRWPGHAVAGGVCDEPAISVDFWPTLAQAAGVGPNDRTQRIDGDSLVPLLHDPDATLGRDAIAWHYPHYHHMAPAAAIRMGDWKLIRHFDGSDGRFDDSADELYDLSDDIGETQNRAGEESEKRAELAERLDTWLLEVDALLPSENPDADADRAGEWWNRRTGQPLPAATTGRAHAQPDVR